MRTLSRRLLTAIATDGAELRRLVRIYTRSGVTELVSGPAPIEGRASSVAFVSPVEASLDPFTSALSVGERHVTLAIDPVTVELLVADHVAGCRLEVYLGAASLAVSSWVLEWIGTVLDAPTETTIVAVRATDVSSILRAGELGGAWVAMHPLAIAADIGARLDVPAALLNTASLDHRQYERISHLSVSRAALDGINIDPETPIAPINGWAAIQELAQLAGGAIVFDEQLRAAFRPRPGRVPVVRHFTADLVRDFKLESVASGRFDLLTIEFAKVGQGDPAVYRVRVPGAADDHAFEGHGPRSVERKLPLPWVHGRAEFDHDIPATAPGVLYTFSIFEAERNGFCGFRFATFGQPQEAHDAISAERRAWLQIDSEIVEVFGINYVAGASFRSGSIAGTTTPSFYPLALEANITVHRGALGTAIAAHVWADSGGAVFDVTIPVLLGQWYARFAHGVALARFTVPMSELALELLDPVSFDEPSCVFRGVNGADAGVHWLVRGLRVDPDASTPSIEVSVELHEIVALTVGQPVDSTEVVEVLAAPPAPRRGAQLAWDESHTRTIIDGLLPTVASGRVLTIPAGDIDGTTGRQRQRQERTYELEASRDHYLRWSSRSGALTLVSVPNGDPTPAMRPGTTAIARIVTNAGAITSITDQRPRRPLDGARLVDASVPSGRMAYPLDTAVSQIESPLGGSVWRRHVGAQDTSGASSATLVAVDVPIKSGSQIEVRVIATRASNDDSSAWVLRARVAHDGTAPSIVASSTEYSSEDDGTWGGVALAVVGDTIEVRVTGAASQDIRWCGVAEIVAAGA